MSNEMISVPRYKLKTLIAQCLDEAGGNPDLILEELRALLAKPAEQHQGNAVAAEVCAYTPGMGQVELKLPGNLPSWLELGEKVTVLHGHVQPQGEPIRLTAVAELIDNGDGGLEPSWLLEGGTAELFPGMVLLVADNAPKLCEEDGSAEVYTRPAEQPEPISSTSDKYKAELYDEVWQLARDMGFGNVTDALMKLKKQTAPVAVVLPEPFCRQKLSAEGKPYPRSNCAVCGPFSPKWRECDAMIEAARLNPPQQ